MNSSSSQFLIFLRQTLQASCEDLTEAMTVIPAIFLRRSAHTTPNESSLRDGLKRFTNDFAVLLPYLTHRLILHTLQTWFAQFSFLGRPLFADFNSFRSAIYTASCLSILNPTLVRALRVPAKTKLYFHWLTFDRQTVVDVSRLHINEGARRNKQCAGCRRFPSPRSSRASIFPSPFPFLAPATQARKREVINTERGKTCNRCQTWENK